MRLNLTLLFLLILKFPVAREIDEYMNTYKLSGKTDFKKEQHIIETYSYGKLEDKLEPWFNDSVVNLRRKACYFVYKKGIISKPRHRQKAVLQLLESCKDKNGGIVGQSLTYLHEFPPESFGNDAKNTIDQLLAKKQAIHFKKLAMLAGIVETGQETLRKKFLMPDINNEIKWAIALALARQGSSEHTNYCVQLANKLPANNNLISYIIPDLIYTRQKQAIDYCVQIINKDSKDCYSPNPDKPEFILCAYFVMELLAPVIMDFPLKTDATGTLVTGDYEKALITARAWFANNPNYKIKISP